MRYGAASKSNKALILDGLRSDWALGRDAETTTYSPLVTPVHPNFWEWISRPSEWSDLVWHRYSQLKHDHPEKWTPTRYRFGAVGRWLLTAVLLHSCAESLEPGRQIFDNRLW